MTMTERRRAKKFQAVSHMSAGIGSAWQLMLLTAVLQLTVIAIAAVSCVKSGEEVITAPVSAVFTFIQFLVCTFPAGRFYDFAVDKNFRGVYNGSVIPDAFLSTLPFKAQDSRNFRLILWEQTAAVNALIVSLGHIISLIAEARGYPVHHGVSGLFTLLAVVVEAFLIAPYIIDNNKLLITIGMIVGMGFAMMCGIMDEIDGVPADAFAPLKIFSGISGILIYCAATLFIAFLGEMYIKHRKNVSWRLPK